MNDITTPATPIPDHQSGISDFVGIEYPQTDIDRYGYSSIAEKVSELDPDQIRVGETDAERLVSETAELVSERRVDRLVTHFGSYEALCEAARAGTDEDGYDELVSVPGVSTRAAAAIRRELSSTGDLP